MFERFRRTAAAPSTSGFSFFGKLPFDREFLRFGLDSPQGRWMVHWVEEAHDVMAARRDDTVADVEVRAVLAAPDAKEIAVALLGPSTDGGGRSYLYCIFCVLPGTELPEQWHLAPLWAEPLWKAMREQILDAGASSRDGLATLLEDTPIEPSELAAAEDRFTASAEATVERPWETITGVDTAAARTLASSLTQLGGAQRAAKESAGGAVAVLIPLTTASGIDEPVDAALWLRLFSAVSGGDQPWPGIVEVRRRSGEPSRSLCVFGREPTGRDLAFLIDGAGDSGIDDLREPWNSEPSADRDVRCFETIVSPEAGRVADLWRGLD